MYTCPSTKNSAYPPVEGDPDLDVVLHVRQPFVLHAAVECSGIKLGSAAIFW